MRSETRDTKTITLYELSLEYVFFDGMCRVGIVTLWHYERRCARCAEVTRGLTALFPAKRLGKSSMNRRLSRRGRLLCLHGCARCENDITNRVWLVSFLECTVKALSKNKRLLASIFGRQTQLPDTEQLAVFVRRLFRQDDCPADCRSSIYIKR